MSLYVGSWDSVVRRKNSVKVTSFQVGVGAYAVTLALYLVLIPEFDVTSPQL
jgi:hypothetical protein